MSDSNSESLYLPPDSANGWIYQPEYYTIDPHSNVAHTDDASITFTAQVKDFPGPPGSGYPFAFACTLAGLSCTVNGQPATRNPESNETYYEPLDDDGKVRINTVPFYVYQCPIDAPSIGSSQTLEVTFYSFFSSQEQLWSRNEDGDSSGGCAFLFFYEYYDPTNHILAAAYPFNLLAGPTSTQNFNLKCDCGCPTC